MGIAILVMVPCLVGMYFMWDENTITDGANDNLTGCYMGIAILKAMKDQGIELEHTEVGVIISGSEEAGLRGAMAWCEAHKGEFDDVPTWIYSYDTIHESRFLGVNYRDLNGTAKKSAIRSLRQQTSSASNAQRRGFLPLAEQRTMRLSTKQVSAQQASPLSTTTFKTIITPCATLPTISIPNALQIAMLYPSSALKTSIATSQNNFTKTKTTKKNVFRKKGVFLLRQYFSLKLQINFVRTNRANLCNTRLARFPFSAFRDCRLYA